MNDANPAYRVHPPTASWSEFTRPVRLFDVMERGVRAACPCVGVKGWSQL
ncbi:hypothetical protein AB0D35_12495 [Streptomyces sp. NPDC048301]